MNKRRFKLFLGIFFLFTLFSTAVYAQGNPFDVIFRAVERIGPLYAKYFYAIDCIMYAVILIGAAQYALNQQFEGRGGKAVIIGLGSSLAIAASYFEYRQGASGFKLIGNLAPAAVILTLILFMFLFYRLFTNLGANGRVAGMLMFSIGFFYINSQFPQIGAWAISKGDWLAFVWAILEAMAIIMFVWGIIELIAMFVKASGVGGGISSMFSPRDRTADTTRTAPTTARDEVAPPSTEREEPEYDIKRPGFIEAFVTDLRNNPLAGVDVIAIGASAGVPRQWAFWRRRSPFWREETGDDGRAVIKVPSGNLRVEANGRGWKFYDLTCANVKTTFVIVEAGQTTTIAIRMRKDETQPNPHIINVETQQGNTRDENQYHFVGRID
ncbi:hypothetical protein COV19_00490 [Candidatus Woesearchaeota archaeon CG10_big_fil_rev_8_21_14_0_10_44_13]|nr:MAG: hypothetical protein COV19_00490 [Candidatus Woesearchaeota archaeon CG10_big_fil_rev_8_21_14_0_10_44_13]